MGAHGLEWLHPETPLAHPLDGEAAALERSLEATATALGADADAWRSLFGPLVDDWEEHEAVMETARRPVGRVTIANSDSGWSAYAHVAIDEARRAVGELPAG